MAPLESQLSIETTQAMQVPATLIGTLSMHALTKGLLMLTFIIYQPLIFLCSLMLGKKYSQIEMLTNFLYFIESKVTCKEDVFHKIRSFHNCHLCIGYSNSGYTLEINQRKYLQISWSNQF